MPQFALRGLTPTFGSFDDEQFDERQLEHRFADNTAFPVVGYWIRKLQARFSAGEYAAALEASSWAQRLLGTSPIWNTASLRWIFVMADYHLYGALARATACDTASADQRQQHVAALVDCSVSFGTNCGALLFCPGVQVPARPGPVKGMRKAAIVLRPTGIEVIDQLLP